MFAFGAGSLIGFFRTKSEGFGRFTTSTPLIILVLTIAGLLFAAGRLQGDAGRGVPAGKLFPVCCVFEMRRLGVLSWVSFIRDSVAGNTLQWMAAF